MKKTKVYVVVCDAEGCEGYRFVTVDYRMAQACASGHQRITHHYRKVRMMNEYRLVNNSSPTVIDGRPS